MAYMEKKSNAGATGIKKTATSRSTGKKASTVKKLTPITKEQFTSNGATGKKVSKPLTSSTSSIKRTSSSGKVNLPYRNGTRSTMQKLPYKPDTGGKLEKLKY